MRSLLIMTVALVVLACVFAYDTSRLETIEIDDIISNKRIFVNHCKCILGEGPCTADGKEMKAIIPDAFKDKCASCAPKVKLNMAKILQELKKNHPENCEKILKKFGSTEKELDDFVTSNIPA